MGETDEFEYKTAPLRYPKPHYTRLVEYSRLLYNTYPLGSLRLARGYVLGRSICYHGGRVVTQSSTGEWVIAGYGLYKVCVTR